MKTVKILIVILLIGIFALSAVSCKLVNAIWKTVMIRGSGNVMSEDRDISGFSKVSISGSGNLFIEQGNEESLTIEAEDNIIPLIIAEVSGDTLNIRLKRGVSLTDIKEINYYLSLKDLSMLEKSGSVDISCSSLDTGSLTIKNSGSGDIEISDLTANALKVNSSGSANYIFSGVAGSQEIKFSGSGTYIGRDLVSDKCVINSSGSTDITVNVTDSLDIKISGSGDVKYIGSPTINTNISGSSEVINISD